MPSIYIALGSNIDPENNLKAAATMLRERHPAVRFSSVYRSAPLHHEEQDDFLNAVARIDADHTPDAIYAFLTHIEGLLKKNPPFKFGPRTIDLDLLLHGNVIQPNPPLILPHPRMHERRFVLEPLTELLHPKEKHPILGKAWEELLQMTKGQQIAEMQIEL